MAIDKDGNTYGEIHVPCEQCGHLNTLRQMDGKAQSRNGLFMAEIYEIVEGLDAEGERSRVVASKTAQRILEMLRPSAERYRQSRPFYRVEVLDGSEWYHITPKTG